MSSGRYSKVIVSCIILLNVAFTAGVLYVSTTGNIVPDSLIGGFFAFTTGELWMIASIKKVKEKRK